MSDEQETTDAPAEKVRTGPYHKGYEKGFADGVAQATRGKSTHFDAAKEIAAEFWVESDESIRARLSKMADEQYLGHQLSSADTELVLGIARRKRSSANAERDAIKSLVRQKPEGRQQVHRTEGDIVVR